MVSHSHFDGKYHISGVGSRNPPPPSLKVGSSEWTKKGVDSANEILIQRSFGQQQKKHVGASTSLFPLEVHGKTKKCSMKIHERPTLLIDSELGLEDGSVDPRRFVVRLSQPGEITHTETKRNGSTGQVLAPEDQFHLGRRISGL